MKIPRLTKIDDNWMFWITFFNRLDHSLDFLLREFMCLWLVIIPPQQGWVVADSFREFRKQLMFRLAVRPQSLADMK